VIRDVIGETLYPQLFAQAEVVRWRMQDIPWRRLDRGAVSDALRQLVREIAFSEMTTATATRRFLTDFPDDIDLTQWIAVWFYEETKHPDVLLRWLRQVGVVVDDRFVHHGRATAPFMRSRMGTLVTNVISEMVASTGYVALRDRSPEPVLGQIAGRLAADEARHCASFYQYARRHLERSRDPDRERRDALKILFMWFHSNELVSHPVSEFFQRHQVAFDITTVRDRVSRLIGLLIGLELTGSSDLGQHLSRLGAKP